MQLEKELHATIFQDQVQKAQLNILFSAAWVRTRIAESLKPFGVSAEQFNVLRIIRGQHGNEILIKDITARMLERNSNTTRIIDRLEAKGLVQRGISSRDRRERPVSLTPSGSELLAKIDREWLNNNPHIANWTAEEAQIVSKLLDKMREL